MPYTRTYNSYCESTWTLRTHTRTNAHRPYEYRRRKTEQEVEEARTRKSGPFGRALKTLHDWGWRPLSGWWEWTVPGATGALQLTGDFKLVKHNIREQLRSQQITQLIARRPRQFAGMHYHHWRRKFQTCHRLTDGPHA